LLYANNLFFITQNQDMSHFFSSSFRLGILGGGQLGKMLLYYTPRWDINVAIMDENPTAPARLSAHTFVQKSLLEEAAVYEFGQNVDILSLEIENVNLDALDKLVAEGKKVYPQPHILRIIQDKTCQKQFYVDNQFPTMPFLIYENKKALALAIENKTQRLPFVWKAPRFGYDGKGVQIIRSLADIDNLPDTRMLVEEMATIQKELAVIVARSSTGEIATFPTVEMDFHGDANLVELVGCPAQISAEQNELAQKIALDLANTFGIIGLLAVEFFLLENGTIVINECAPRPHNSGHLFTEAAYTSQFEQHIRAILGLPLGNTTLHTPAVMVNLVGAEGHSGNVFYEGMIDVLRIPNASPHLYGKTETRPFRKMGHITVLAPTLQEAYQQANIIQASIKVVSI
jgi:5-(carboxyamino)imidazole ribonucleotide synthase